MCSFDIASDANADICESGDPGAGIVDEGQAGLDGDAMGNACDDDMNATARGANPDDRSFDAYADQAEQVGDGSG